MLFAFKSQPADFIVDEILGHVERHDDGQYHYFRIQKENENTMDVIHHLTEHT
jgi:tRNA(Glu) U13 pseudouridine synthase TruD